MKVRIDLRQGTFYIRNAHTIHTYEYGPSIPLTRFTILQFSRVVRSFKGGPY